MKSQTDVHVDGSMIPDDQWTFERYSTDGMRAYYTYEDPVTGIGIRKAVNLAEPVMIQRNVEEFNDSIGKRWGDGRVAARIPMNKFYQDVAPRLKEGDLDFVKWYLNHEKTKPFRTFKGRI